jgi:5-methyltetrahydrofolate corrinoid/iron sulfur protein methyltransferase
MILIGERINGKLQKIREAIYQRDENTIAWLAKAQTEAGVDYIYLNAATSPEREINDLKWLVDVVQSTVVTPICLETISAKAVEELIPILHVPGIINSVRWDKNHLKAILPVIRESDSKVIALLMGKKEVPHTVEGRITIAEKIINLLFETGVKQEQILVDPTVIAIATKPDAGTIFLETLTCLHEKFPWVKTVTGLKTISFGLLDEKNITKAFLILALGRGLDGIIMNPFDLELISLLQSARIVLGMKKSRIKTITLQKQLV